MKQLFPPHGSVGGIPGLGEDLKPPIVVIVLARNGAEELLAVNTKEVRPLVIPSEILDDESATEFWIVRCAFVCVSP